MCEPHLLLLDRGRNIRHRESHRSQAGQVQWGPMRLDVHTQGQAERAHSVKCVPRKCAEARSCSGFSVAPLSPWPLGLCKDGLCPGDSRAQGTFATSRHLCACSCPRSQIPGHRGTPGPFGTKAACQTRVGVPPGWHPEAKSVIKRILQTQRVEATLLFTVRVKLFKKVAMPTLFPRASYNEWQTPCARNRIPETTCIIDPGMQQVSREI